MPFLLFLGLFFVSPAPTQAEPFFCHSYDSIPFKVEDCDDNEKLGREALSCVIKYYERVQQAQEEVLKKFQVQIAALQGSQTDPFSRTKKGYQEAQKKLEDLLSEGKSARASVDDLLLNLSFPEDYDEPVVTGMSKEKYLASQKCFSIPRRVLNQSQHMLDKIMSDLALTKESMFGKQNNAQSRSEQMEAVEGNKQARHTSGKGSSAAAKGKSQNPASDITGTFSEPKNK